MMKDISRFCIHLNNSIHEALACINQGDAGIALVVDEGGQLLNTVTDGDVRRALLAGLSLDDPVEALLEQKKDAVKHQPITAGVDTPAGELLRMMQAKVLRQIPILDGEKVVVDLVTIDDLLPGQKLPLTAVIMAGGYGKRLLPLTEDLPKPMLPIGGKPLIELIVGHLRDMGVEQVLISTHYLTKKIEGHLGDGDDFGVKINYLVENEPLGTAGALSLIEEKPETPLLVINGDVLTKLNYRDMLATHEKLDAELTVGVRQYNFNVPYGVVEVDGSEVKGIREKPTYNFLVNGGIYMVQPQALGLIPKDEFFNMTDLIEALVAEKKKVASFLVTEYWLDVGQYDDYQQAQDDIKNGRYS